MTCRFIESTVSSSRAILVPGLMFQVPYASIVLSCDPDMLEEQWSSSKIWIIPEAPPKNLTARWSFRIRARTFKPKYHMQLRGLWPHRAHKFECGSGPAHNISAELFEQDTLPKTSIQRDSPGCNVQLHKVNTKRPNHAFGRLPEPDAQLRCMFNFSGTWEAGAVWTSTFLLCATPHSQFASIAHASVSHS